MNWKNDTKTVWRLFACTTILLLLVMAGVFWNLVRIKNEQQVLLHSMRMKNTELTKQRNALGQEVSTFRATQITLKQLNVTNDSIIQCLKKEVKYWKALVSHTGVSSSTVDTVYMPVKDTIWYTSDSIAVKAQKFDYEDFWMKLHGIVFNDSVKLDYNLRNEVTIDYYWSRDHLFGKKYLTGSVTQKNPKTTTGQVTQFTIPSDPPAWYEKWWVDLTIGMGIGFTTGIIILNH